MWAWSLDITDLDWEVDCVLFSLKGSEKSVDVLSVISSKGSLWILNFKDSEIVIVLIQSLESSCVNLILQLGNTQVLNLDRIGNCPLETYWGCW